MNVRRLETEAIRDAIMSVSGDGVTRMFGPPIVVNPDDVGQVVIGKATRDGNGIMVAKTEASDDLFRRTIHVQVRRSMTLGMLEPFDVAATTPEKPPVLLAYAPSKPSADEAPFEAVLGKPAGNVLVPNVDAKHAWVNSPLPASGAH